MLFFTGFSRFSSELANTQKQAIGDKIRELKEMLSIVDEAEKLLTSKSNLDDFGKLLHYT